MWEKKHPLPAYWFTSVHSIDVQNFVFECPLIMTAAQQVWTNVLVFWHPNNSFGQLMYEGCAKGPRKRASLSFDLRHAITSESCFYSRERVGTSRRQRYPSYIGRIWPGIPTPGHQTTRSSENLTATWQHFILKWIESLLRNHHT